MSIIMLTEKIIEQFNGRIHKERPFIVAIDGLSGAGKTTITNGIAAALAEPSTAFG